MTGIERVGWPTAPRVASRPAAKSGFFVPSEAAWPGQADAVAVPAATSLGSMLALQEADFETVEDREARKHGHDMLAALAELQRALLGGGGDAVALERLGDLAASARHATDPRLAAMVSAIVLRVRVELARRQG
jgi:hypothetical protein